ncbi:MAG: S8 family serine peptidase, partial [Chloroflexota bacterium]|nr:S8 family serine peptidase [Chloroflexota bacterium]
MNRRLPVLFLAAMLTIALVLPILPAATTADASPVQTDGGIQVRVPNFAFDPILEGEPKLSNEQRFEATDSGFRLVQFYGPTEDAWLVELEASGLTILQYYPHYTYLVWADAAATRAASQFDFVRWTGSFHPVYKVNSDLTGREGIVQNVDILFYNDGKIDETLAAIEALGGNIVQVYPAQPDKAFFDAIVEMDANSFDSIATIGSVLWFGYSHPEPVLDDEMATQIVAGNTVGGVPQLGYYAHLANLGYDGTGVRWATVDTGVDYAHPDLNTHIAGGYSFPGACASPDAGDDCPNGGHGTHVTGIIGGTGAGDGVGNTTDPDGFLYGVGIAPGYEIFAMNSLSASAWPPTGGWQEHSKRAVLGGAIGGNNSWTTGEGTQHGYQASERTHDIMVLDGNFDTTSVAEPFIEVFSAGNSGFSGLTSPKEGKNLIVTAASLNYRAGNIDTIAGFSSRGPAVDGRWVPTIAAPGDDIASTRRLGTASQCTSTIAGTNGLYSLCSGTSMAAPQTSGTIVLATEWWRDTQGGNDPSSAMAKALVVNGAVDMGTPDIPNIHEGWGRINSTNIISPAVPTLYWDLPVDFANSGESWQLSLGVIDPGQPLKVTLVWADAPGAVGANPALVNNLDLTVENGGNTYLGNVFSGGWSQTGGAADSINNLENVYVESPGGDIDITVDAVNIAGDAILYNGDPTDQSFALVCNNCALFRDFTLDATPASAAICTPDDAVYDIEVGQILGYDDPVTLSTSGEPVGTTATFDTNPVIPPGMSQLTISDTAAATPGSYSIAVAGIAPTSTHTVIVGLEIFDAAPAAPDLLTPPDGAFNVSTTPAFTWSDVGATSTLIEIATDNAFNNIVDSATVPGTSYSGASLNTSVTYFWRVTADNACGNNTSVTWSFTTLAAPGDCGPGTTPYQVFFDDFESGAVGWTTGGTASTWGVGGGVAPSGPVSGSSVYHADDVGFVSDQYLISPAVALPVGQLPLSLKFWNYQEIEDSFSGCFDGGLLEISTNGGATWTQLEAEL